MGNKFFFIKSHVIYIGLGFVVTKLCYVLFILVEPTYSILGPHGLFKYLSVPGILHIRLVKTSCGPKKNCSPL